MCFDLFFYLTLYFKELKLFFLPFYFDCASRLIDCASHKFKKETLKFSSYPIIEYLNP